MALPWSAAFQWLLTRVSFAPQGIFFVVATKKLLLVSSRHRSIKNYPSWVWWLMPVIPGTPEVEIRRLMV
jgi:hypothetical protein